MEEITKRNLLNNVIARGKQLSDGFRDLSNKFPNIISSNRGLGLIQGLVIKDEYIEAKSIALKAELVPIILPAPM